MTTEFTHHSALNDAINERFEATLQTLTDLVAIPSIAWESHDLTQVDRSAEAVAALARKAGFDNARIERATYTTADGTEKQGMPAVIASRPAAEGYPTILLYAHHDVQPAGNLDLWDTAPFVATRKGDRLYGRGAADDKAGILVHLAALAAINETLGDDFKLGVKLFIEGEEEAGSPSFVSFLNTYRDELSADYIIVADSANWRAGVPALTTSLRGVASGDIEVRVGSHAIHSGMFGGPMLDAHTLMAQLLATLHDATGAVAVEGLHRAPEPELEYAEADFRNDSGILDSVPLAGTGTVASRLWTQPAISVIGMDIPSIATSSNTLAVLSRARISTRLAPGDTPENAHRALAEHVKAHAPHGAEVSYTAVDSGMPFSTEVDADGAQTALDAMRAAWDLEPVQTGMGGSIPFIADLKQTFPHAQILVTGKTPTPAPTAPTSPCTSRTSRTQSWRRHCCSAHSAPARRRRSASKTPRRAGHQPAHRRAAAMRNTAARYRSGGVAPPQRSRYCNCDTEAGCRGREPASRPTNESPNTSTPHHKFGILEAELP